MPSPSLPPEVRRSAGAYLEAADRAVPGLVEGLYLHGSLTYGDYRPGRSDIDFVAVLSGRPADHVVRRLGEALTELGRHHPRPYFDGLHVTRADLAGPPADCPDVPCIGEWEFQPAGRFGVNPVTWHELARGAITLRGPRLGPGDVWADETALRTYSHGNLRDYWLPSLAKLRAGEGAVASGPAERAQGLTEWFVLGVARLHHLLATGRLTSKGGAGRHALTAFGTEWHPIVNEALRIRNGAGIPSPGYDSDPAARVRDTIAFVEPAIEAGLRLGP
ncbi:aminoglycoside adenylyltransferase domain-containing protein [Streptomyces sp. NPDC097981]|uniref:nucleotidyltransferase domain-containing protein n=1 Tax=Streptomyces sp. NPDC097981 TaxID=3155428 RepID=UPI00333147C4